MNSQSSQIDIIKRYINLIFSQHKLIVGCVLVAITIGSAKYLDSPKMYKSSASIIYQKQRINPSRFSPDEEKHIQEMVNTISQQVMSRSNLEKIIKDHNLYPETRAEVPIEDIIERMRTKNITISSNKEMGNVFQVSFQGRNPRKVMRVTNALAAQFIEENIRIREERASETTDYIQDELRMSKEVLEEKEARMRDYKLKHYNEMPEQRASNMSRLNALQEQFQSIQSNINSLGQTRRLVAEQLELRRQLQGEGDDGGTMVSGGESVSDLARARKELQMLQARYTNEHPTVKRLQKQIEQLEAERRLNLNDGESRDTDTHEQSDSTFSDPRMRELSLQLQELDMKLQSLRNQRKEIHQRIEKFEKWIDAAPVREAEWAALTRDYDELKKYHDALVAQSLSAEAAESLEVRQKGSQFRVVDSAYLPETPIKGKLFRFLIISLTAGLGAGIGLTLGYDLLNSTFRDSREIEDFLQVPVTCALPIIVTETEKRKNLRKNICWYSFFSIWFITLLSAAGYFWSRGDIIL